MFADRASMIAPLLPEGGTIPTLTPPEARMLVDRLRQSHQVVALFEEIEKALSVPEVDGDVLERAYDLGRDISDALTASDLVSEAKGMRLKGVSRLAALSFEAGLSGHDFLALVEAQRPAFEGRMPSEWVDHVIGAADDRGPAARSLSA
ncbi:hypothetical protein [Prosthecodimorpha staleyi]|uniref:Uncharacterized protein n=1 Tax=Prosthecodimorpha staleyi TaxID=2840188 RepID=A0A947DA82_9HYPH|nr:hypothetical protein [Prosthecodimorpha staleyi]MBT9291402.1 hypothetical protein [Prosthecodimorpha staleyi]